MAKLPPQVAVRRPTAADIPHPIPHTPLKDRRTLAKNRRDNTTTLAFRSSQLVLHKAGSRSNAQAANDSQLALETASLLGTITSAGQGPHSPECDGKKNATSSTEEPCSVSTAFDIEDGFVEKATKHHEAQRENSKVGKSDVPTLEWAHDVAWTKTIMPTITNMRRQAQLLSLDVRFNHLKRRYYHNDDCNDEILLDLETLCQRYYALSEYNSSASTQLWMAVVRDRAKHTAIVVEYLAELLTGIPGKHFSDADKFQLEKLIVNHGSQVWHCMLNVARGVDGQDKSGMYSSEETEEQASKFIDGVLTYIRGLYSNRGEWPTIYREQDTLYAGLMDHVVHQPNLMSPQGAPHEVISQNNADDDKPPHSGVSLVFKRCRDRPSKQKILANKQKRMLRPHQRYTSILSTGSDSISSRVAAQSGTDSRPVESASLRTEQEQSGTPAQCIDSSQSIINHWLANTPNEQKQSTEEIPPSEPPTAKYFTFLDNSRTEHSVLPNMFGKSMRGMNAEQDLEEPIPQGHGQPRRLSQIAIGEEGLATDTPGGAELDKLLRNRRTSEERRKDLTSPLEMSSSISTGILTKSFLGGKSKVQSPLELTISPPLSPRRDSAVHVHSPLSQSSSTWDQDSDGKSSGGNSDDRDGAISPHTLPAPRADTHKTTQYSDLHVKRLHNEGTDAHVPLLVQSRYKNLHDELEQTAGSSQDDDVSSRTRASAYTESGESIFGHQPISLDDVSGEAEYAFDDPCRLSDHAHYCYSPGLPSTISQLLKYKYPSDKSTSTEAQSSDWPVMPGDSPQTPGYNPTRYRSRDEVPQRGRHEKASHRAPRSQTTGSDRSGARNDEGEVEEQGERHDEVGRYTSIST